MKNLSIFTNNYTLQQNKANQSYFQTKLRKFIIGKVSLQEMLKEILLTEQSIIKWESSSVSGVKGCRFKINLEMPKLSIFRSAPRRPHAWYYIYGEPHTYTCCPLNPQTHRTRLLAATPPRGRGNFHFQN